MTWAAAYRAADQQIAHWQENGVSPAEATRALDLSPDAQWQLVRQLLAAWVQLLDAYQLWE